MKKVHIISEGEPRKTKVYETDGRKEIQGITKISYEIGVDDSIGRANIELLAPSLDVVADGKFFYGKAEVVTENYLRDYLLAEAKDDQIDFVAARYAAEILLRRFPHGVHIVDQKP